MLVTANFIDLFKQPGASPARGKYLARLFGIFSEELVRIWAADPRAPYEDLGRPTLRLTGRKSGSTLDFTLRSRSTGKVYVAELKCEIEYKDYRYFVLTESRQLDHHNKEAFGALLAAASRHHELPVYVKGQETPIDGAILVWGAATSEGRAAVSVQNGFAAVLTLAEIVEDLQTWRSEPFRALLTMRQDWSNELYRGLLGSEHLNNSTEALNLPK